MADNFFGSTAAPTRARGLASDVAIPGSAAPLPAEALTPASTAPFPEAMGGAWSSVEAQFTSVIEETSCCGPRGGGSRDKAERAFTPTPTGSDVFKVKDAEVPDVLKDFLVARAHGDAASAASCCSKDMTMAGPKGEFKGLDAVRERAFSKPSQPVEKVILPLQHLPDLSTTEYATYVREFEAQIGPDLVMPLRQEFQVTAPGTLGAKVSRVHFKPLGEVSRLRG